VGDSCLYEAVCRKRRELWLTVGYMKRQRPEHLPVFWLHEAVFRQRPKLWLRVGYMKKCVDRNLNCG